MAYTKKMKIEFLKIYSKYFGNISMSVKQFNKQYKEQLGNKEMVRRTYYTWLNKKQTITKGSTFADLISDADSVVIDNADFFLKAMTAKNNLKAICFLLKHRHPDYKSKIEISDPERKLANERLEEMRLMIKQNVETKTTKIISGENSNIKNSITPVHAGGKTD